ncbi:MAG: type II secretion system F family protein [Alphaproteobacteria bacterium]|nr:type II secretion system F family protein [Alphaproteobacteria bacterium]
MNLKQLIPFGVGLEEFIALGAAVFVAISIVVVWRGLLEKAPAQRRIKAIVERRATLRQALVAPKRRGRAETLNVARRTLRYFRLMTGKPVENARSKLIRAGFRSRDAVTLFLFAKLCLPIVLGVMVVVMAYVVELYDLAPRTRLFMSLGAILLGFYLPDLLVKNLIDKRTHLLTRSMPDMLDLLVICAEAGLALDNALVRVSKEIRLNCAEMADEMELTSAELGFMSERRIALENLYKRTALPSMQALANTLIQSERYGTPLAQSLRVLSRELRDERLMKAEEKAARLPATLTVPMMIFIMPTLFIVLIGPGILRAIDGLGGLAK